MGMTEQEINHIRFFKEQTEKRIKELESKKHLTRAEVFELDMCRYDAKRSKKEIDRYEKEFEAL